MQARTLSTASAQAVVNAPRGKARTSGPSAGHTWTVPGLCLRLAYVAPGSFLMGSDDGEADEKPVHEVRLSHGFWMGIVAVTQAEYKAVMLVDAGARGGEETDPSTFKDSRNPVETVSWDDAVAFCETLTRRERRAGRVPAGHEYRLPTEAEWEYAARGGAKSGGYLYSGSNAVDEVAWHEANSGSSTHPVGQKQPNELGLYDMSGNVWEWCLGWYDSAFYGHSPNVDPENTQRSCYRVRRGGSWIDDADGVRSAYRFWYGPSHANDTVGFRVCLAPQTEGW